MNSNYWELLRTDGESKLVPPQYAQAIKDDIRSGKTHLSTYEPILIRSIKDFRETDKPYIDPSHQLTAGELTEAQAAFGIVETEYGVKAIAVKKRIPGNRRSYYEKSGYTFLDGGEDVTVVGFWIPAHKMSNSLEKCTKEEAVRIR
jgi:hypothetical protein